MQVLVVMKVAIKSQSLMMSLITTERCTDDSLQVLLCSQRRFLLCSRLYYIAHPFQQRLSPSGQSPRQVMLSVYPLLLWCLPCQHPVRLDESCDDVAAAV